MDRRTLLAAPLAAAFLAILPSAPSHAAVAAPPQPAGEAAAYEKLARAAKAVVGLKVKALANARSNATLGERRTGSGVLLETRGLVLTIGYLVLEADQVDVTTSDGRTLPAAVVAYDHATGFGLLRPFAPLDVPGARLGASSSVKVSDRMLVVAAAGEDSLSVATVVSRRPFAGYWEYLLDDAIFTAPPRGDFGGAALINAQGDLVGIGSLFVMDAASPGERVPGNMFVPVDLLKPILDEMVETGRQKGGMRPWLGISSVEDDGRLKVVRVAEDSPAQKAGIAPGDLILALSGERVGKLEEFYRRLWSAGQPGVEVTLRVLKGTDVQDVRVRSIDRFDILRRKPAI